MPDHKPRYTAPDGGHPSQTELLTGRAAFTEAWDGTAPIDILRGILQAVKLRPAGRRKF